MDVKSSREIHRKSTITELFSTYSIDHTELLVTFHYFKISEVKLNGEYKFLRSDDFSITANYKRKKKKWIDKIINIWKKDNI